MIRTFLSHVVYCDECRKQISHCYDRPDMALACAFRGGATIITEGESMEPRTLCKKCKSARKHAAITIIG